MSRATSWTSVRGKFGGNRSKSKVAEVVRRSRDKIVTIYGDPIGYRIRIADKKCYIMLMEGHITLRQYFGGHSEFLLIKNFPQEIHW